MENEKEKAEAVKGIRAELDVYTKLRELKSTPGFENFLVFLTRATSIQMMTAFVGNDVKCWEDFLKIRGEVVANLRILQEVGGSEMIEKQLSDQLKQYLNPEY
jgi:hypothetical protein